MELDAYEMTESEVKPKFAFNIKLKEELNADKAFKVNISQFDQSYIGRSLK
jgi:hypothetical protein